MKKILFIHYGGGIGGAPVSMINTIASLDKNDYDSLAIFTEPGPIIDFAKKLNVATKVIPLKSAFFYSEHISLSFRMLFNFIINYFSTIKNIRKIVETERPDIIYLNTSVLVTVAVGVMRFNIPLVWYVREVPGPNYFLRKLHINMIESCADKIIVNSKYVMQYFSSDKVELVYNSVDFDSFNEKPIENRKKFRNDFVITNQDVVFCMIGNVQAVKGHFDIIQLAKKILKFDSKIKFMVIAGGVNEDYQNTIKGKIKSFLNISFSEFERMRSIIIKSKLSNNFIFTGYRQDIPKIIHATDIILFLSKKAEGFGRPLIEGMAAGKPIIATDIGPTKEILGELTGLLVPINDSEELFKLSKMMLVDKNLRKKFGSNGKKRVINMFDDRFSKNKIKNLFDSL